MNNLVQERGRSGSVDLQVWHNAVGGDDGGHLFGIVGVRRERDGSVVSFDVPVVRRWVRFSHADIAGGGVTVMFKALTGSDYQTGSGLSEPEEGLSRGVIKFDAQMWRGADAALTVTVVPSPSVVDVEVDVDPSTDIARPATEGQYAVHEETCRWNLTGDGCFDVGEGGSEVYRLRLRKRPAAGDTLTVTPLQAAMNGGADLVFSPSTVSFTDSNWNDWQTVTVTAPHDVDTRWGEFRIEHRFSPNFGEHDDPTARSFSRFHGRVVDDDRVEMVVKDSQGRVVGAGGLSDNLSLWAGSETFVTVELTHEPTDTHTVRATARDLDGATRPPVGLRHPSHPQFRADHANPSPALIADIRSYIAETHFGEAHVNHWKRVLETLGVEDYPGLEPLTLAEAFRNTGRRMAPVRELLTAQQRGGYPLHSLNYSSTGIQFTRWNWNTPQKIIIRRWNGATDPRCLTGLPVEETAVGACWKIGLSLVGNGLKQAQTLYLGMPEPGDALQVNLDFDKNTVTEGDTARLWATLTAPNPTSQAIRITQGVHTDSTIGFFEYRFDPRGGYIFIAPGERRGFATLLARTDSVAEPGGETVIVFQGIHRGGVRTNHNDRARITVVDPPPSTLPQVLAAAPSLTLASNVGSVSEGGDVVFTVTADPVPQLDTTVNVFVSEEMGDGLDYIGSGEAFQVTIPAGQSSVDHRLRAYSDNTELADGTIVGRVNTGDGYTLGDPHSVSIDLLDDDEAPVPEVTVTAAHGSVAEGDTAVFTLTAAPAPAGGLPVTVTITANGDYGAVTGSRTVTVPPGGSVSFTVATSDDSVDEPDGSVTVTVNAGDGYTVSATQTTGTVDVTDNDDDDAGPALDPQLEADVRSYAAETQHGTLHVNRWKRVLVAFGLEDYAGLEPTTLDEATVHVDIGRPRWIPVLAHMAAMDAVSPQPAPARRSVQVDAQVLATARAKAAQTHGGAKHVNRWKRVLEAFGDGDYPGVEPLTAAGAQVYANVWSGWDQVAAQLRLIEAAAADPTPVVPVVGITAAADVSEGGDAVFTVTAAPPPSAGLPVSVTVSQSGDFGAGTGSRTVTVPTGGSVSFTVATSDDSADEPDGSVTATVDAGSGYTVSATQGTAAVVVADDDDAPSPGSDQNAPVLDPRLEADVRSYAAETRHGTLHVNRWKRVLVAFGLEDYPGLEPTTLDEARVHVDIGRPRWIPVLAHMAAMDAANPQPPPARGSVQIDAQVLATARSKAAQTHGGAKHVNRWKRVLEAFGDSDYPGIEPLTAAGAQVYANVWSGWDQVAAQLKLIEAAADPTPVVVAPPVVVPTPVIPPVVVAPPPEVSITSSVGGTEGATVSFTLTASPALTSDLDVDVSVVTSGDFGYGPTPTSVTIPPGGTATVTVTTSDDTTDEPDGTVTLTIDAGSGYTVGAYGSGSVDVTDDDDPVAPVVVAPDPVVSITAGSGVTEGGDAGFTLTATPAPATALDVAVTVTQTGDYGAVTGTRTVTVPTTGSVSFTVATTDDATDEPDGSVTVTVDAGSGYTVSNTHGAGTVAVADNDVPPPASSVTVSVGDATGSEAGGVVEFTVSLSEASSEQVRVWFSTSNWRGLTGRAHMWLDYWTAQQTVVFAPGQTKRTVSVWLVDDYRSEPDEYFTVELTNPRGATIGRGAATGTITDDD